MKLITLNYTDHGRIAKTDLNFAQLQYGEILHPGFALGL